MKILLTGGTGQLGQALLAAAPSHLIGQPLLVLAPPRSQFDLSDPLACSSAVLHFKPDWVLNAGAFTSVDLAEQEPRLAAIINREAPARIAEALASITAQTGRPARMLQISTDFVFSGDQSFPYSPGAQPRPINVYGSTKFAAETAVLESLGTQGLAHILRTSWVYGPVGRNFFRTMIRLHREKSMAGVPLRVVADQIGCPTSSDALAKACWRLIELSTLDLISQPIFHWSDSGAATWYDFSVVIGELSARTGLIEKSATVIPISSSDFPAPAKRPRFSLLNCLQTYQILGVTPDHWSIALWRQLAFMAKYHDPVYNASTDLTHYD